MTNVTMGETFKEKLAKTGTGVLDARAANLAEMTKIEAGNVVSSARAKVLRIQASINQHEDLAVNSTTSLRPGGEGFDSKAWVDTGVRLQKDLRVATIEYNLIKKWYDRLFPEDNSVEIPQVEDE